MVKEGRAISCATDTVNQKKMRLQVKLFTSLNIFSLVGTAALNRHKVVAAWFVENHSAG